MADFGQQEEEEKVPEADKKEEVTTTADEEADAYPQKDPYDMEGKAPGKNNEDMEFN